MNNQKMLKSANLKSNIKNKPIATLIKAPKKQKKLPFKVSSFYFLSWAMVASLSVATLTTIVMKEGGVEDAIRTASFNKINRQISENDFVSGVDNLPTASIPQGTGVNDTIAIPEASKPTSLNLDLNEGAKASNIIQEPTYYAVFLGQGGSESIILDLWYSIKNQNNELMSPHEAGYYYDDIDGVFNLVVGKFNSLGKSLQFCAELKFNDIACRYDDKFANLQTTLID